MCIRDRKVSDNLENLHFNTCVSEFMIFTNHIQNLEKLNRDLIKTFIILINPFMPHLAQEFWELIGETNELSYESWPSYDKSVAQLDIITIAIQINGKRRSEIQISRNESDHDVISKAKTDKKVSTYLTESEIIKEIYIKEKIVNIVIK